MILWGKGDDLGWIEIPILLSPLKRLVVRQKKPVREVAPDGVLDHSLPGDRVELTLPRSLEFQIAANSKDPSDSDQDSPCLFAEWNSLGIEEAKGDLGTNRRKKGIQERALVVAALHPLRIEA
jgi:hypothetical protein